MVNNGHTRPSDRESHKKYSVICENNRRLNHWSQTVKKVVIRTFTDCDKSIVIGGGSDNGEFVFIEHVRNDQITYLSDSKFENGDVVLTIQEQKVSGFTYLDAVNWLKHCAKSSTSLVVECIPRGYVLLNLAEFLNHRFRKGSLDHELQSTIRDNLYIRTVPVTTRPPKEFEINGIDYVFLTINEFNKLKLNGTLLESGIYEGNYYGTPKPLRNNYLAVNDKPSLENVTESYLPGVHPSSEGKRKRNRSNVEAMAAKDLDHSSILSNGQSSKDHYSDNMQKKNPPNYYYENSLKYPDQLDEDELGPLPPKWEKAYTENGEVYFIDHNSSTSHWLDPRLSRIQKKSLEDCSEDELPFGWERIDDPLYGTYYIDHVNRQTQYENPVIQAKYGRGSTSNSCNNMNNYSNLSDKNNRSDGYNHDNTYNSYMNNSKYNDGLSENAFFTSNPDELVGERIRSTLVKSYKGLGFTIIGGDDNKEFLQIKSIVTNGPAWYEGKLQTGDVLVYVNNKCVLGYTHHDMVTVFQSISPGETVEIEVCRGYPLPFDPNDPNTKVVTTMAVGSNDNNPNLNSFVDQDAYLKRHIMDADSNDATNSSVKSMPDLYLPEKAMHVPRPTSTDLILQDDDKPEILTMSIVKGSEGFGFTIADSSYGQKVKKIIDKQRCENLQEGDVLAEINNINVRKMCHSDVVQVLKDCTCNKAATITVERMNFSKNKLRKKDDLKLALYRTKTPTENCPLLMEAQNGQKLPDNGMKRPTDMYGMENYNMQACYSRSQSPGNELDQNGSWNRKRSPEMYKHAENNYMSMVSRNNNYYAAANDYGMSRSSSEVNDNYFYSLANNQRKESTSFEHEQPLSTNGDSRLYRRDMPGAGKLYGQDSDYYETVVTIERQETGFGFRIVGGTEEGSQVSIGHIVEGGAAEVDGRLRSGDEIMSVDNQSVMNSSHHHVVELMGKAAINGRVTLGIRRRIPSKNHGNAVMRPEIRYPYDVTVTRRESEGFGFVIISSLNKAGSAIGRIIEGSPAERSGLLHVGDHILAVNGINIMNLHHGDIVNLIKDSGYNVTLTIGMPIDESAGSIVSNSTSHRDDLYDGQYHMIEISRGSRGFGFSIRGGREFQNMALYVLQIAENGPAALDGRLKVGDRLVEINGINTKNMTHGQAIEIIRNGGPTVMLLIQRGGKVPSLPSEESPTQHRNAMMCSPSEPRPVGMMNGRSESWDTQLSSS